MHTRLMHHQESPLANVFSTGYSGSLYVIIRRMDAANPLYQDIQAQGENLSRVIDHLYSAGRQSLREAAAFLQNDRPVAFAGMSSAAYLCQPAAAYLGRGGRFASVLSAAEAYTDLLPALKDANIILNSRSGETAEIVKLSRLLVEMDKPFVLITNDPKSTAARLATYVIDCRARMDRLVSINVVTAMMTATLLLAAQMQGEMDWLRGEVERLPGILQTAVEQAWERAGELADFFAPARPAYLLYRGGYQGAALCGRLVLEEVARWPGAALEAAEFRQGSLEVVDEHFRAAVFIPQGPRGDLSRALAADLARLGGGVLQIGAVKRSGEGNLRGFPIQESGICEPVPAVVPLQIAAYMLARRQGYSPGEVRYISRVIRTEQGIPKEAGGAGLSS